MISRFKRVQASLQALSVAQTALYALNLDPLIRKLVLCVLVSPKSSLHHGRQITSQRVEDFRECAAGR